MIQPLPTENGLTAILNTEELTLFSVTIDVALMTCTMSQDVVVKAVQNSIKGGKRRAT